MQQRGFKATKLKSPETILAEIKDQYNQFTQEFLEERFWTFWDEHGLKKASFYDESDAMAAIEGLKQEFILDHTVEEIRLNQVKTIGDIAEELQEHFPELTFNEIFQNFARFWNADQRTEWWFPSRQNAIDTIEDMKREFVNGAL